MNAKGILSILLLLVVAIGFSGATYAVEEEQIVSVPGSTGDGGIEGSPHVHESPEMPEQHPFYSDLLVVADDDTWALYSEPPKNENTNVIHYYAEIENGSYPVYADTTGSQGTGFWYYDNDPATPSYGSEVVDEFLAGDYDSGIFHFLVIQENTNKHNNPLGSPKIVLSHFVGLFDTPVLPPEDPKPPVEPPVVVPPVEPPVVVPPVDEPVVEAGVPMQETGASGVAAIVALVLIVGGALLYLRRK